jgi:hypothetical protein
VFEQVSSWLEGLAQDIANLATIALAVCDMRAAVWEIVA